MRRAETGEVDMGYRTWNLAALRGWITTWPNVVVTVSAVIVAWQSILVSIGLLPWFSGDASIYLTFAKSMWSTGFFYYGPAGPKGGATSPLWAFILSLLHLADADPILPMKVLALIVFFTGAVALWCVAQYWTRSNFPALVTAGLWLINGYGQHSGYFLAVSLFETTLAALVVLTAAHWTAVVLARLAIGERTGHAGVAWSVNLGILPLVRPEATLVASLFAVCVLVAAWRQHDRGAALFRFAFELGVAAAVALPYFVYMWTNTGSLLFSSLLGRKLVTDTLTAQHGLLNSVWSTLAALYEDVFFVLVVLFIVSLYGFPGRSPGARRFQTLAAATIMLYATPFLLTDTATNDYTVRYLFPIYGLLYLFSGIGLADILTHLNTMVVASGHARRVTLGLVLLLLLGVSTARVMEAFAIGRAAPTFDEVKGREDTMALNELVKPDERVLLYEIQSQYLLNVEAVSLDGIVGGEVIPYLLRGDDLTDFIGRYDWIAVSHAFDYRGELRRTVLKRLYDLDANTAVGQMVAIGPLRFTKAWDRPDRAEIRKFHGAALSIYRIRHL